MADNRASDSRQTEVLVVAWVMTGLAICTVAFKLFARVKVVKIIGWDDFFIILSLVCSILASAFVHYGVTLGFGRHTEIIAAEYGLERLFRTAKFQMLGYPFNIDAFSFPNIAIAILVTQLLDPNPRRTLLIHGMCILQVLFAAITVTLAFAQCRPTSKLWEKTLPGSCWDPNVLNYFSYWFCAYTTLTDVVLAVVPVHAFWKLQMPRSTKIGVCVLMSMTMLSAVVTVVKGTYLRLFTDTVDPLYNPVILVIWGLVEQNIVIMAACVPTMRPLFTSKHRRKTNKSDSNPNTFGSFPSASASASHKRHWERGSSTEMILEDLDDKGNTVSTGSQSGIVRTLEVSMDWKANKLGRMALAKEDVVPRVIAESER